jgi:hypothetical protein
VVFTVVAQECGPLKYQWQRNGQNMLNATNATLVVAGAAWSQACYYQVVVSNDFGTATSTSASLAFVDTKWFGKAWISITGPVGATYHIQARPDLVSGSWTNLADVTLSQGPYIFIDNDSARLKQRFYRVVPVP